MPLRASQSPPGLRCPLVYTPMNAEAGRASSQRALQSFSKLAGGDPQMCRYNDYPSDNYLLGTTFRMTRRAFWGEARPGFGVHWCVYV